MRRPALPTLATLAILALTATSATAQDPPAAGYPPSEQVQVPRWAHPAPEPAEDGKVGPRRSGFTLYLALGLGYQRNNPDDETDGAFENEINNLGLGGLNVGIGGFLTHEIALLFRWTSTIAFLDDGAFDSVTALSGVGAAAVQYWPITPLRLEVGVGVGIHNYEYAVDNITIRREEAGFGLLVALGVAVWQNRNHSLQLGIDYAPAFVEDGPAHNLTFTFGWQLL